MKSLMVNLSEFLTRRRWLVLAAWLGVVVLALPLAAKQTENLVGGGFEVPEASPSSSRTRSPPTSTLPRAGASAPC